MKTGLYCQWERHQKDSLLAFNLICNLYFFLLSWINMFKRTNIHTTNSAAWVASLPRLYLIVILALILLWDFYWIYKAASIIQPIIHVYCSMAEKINNLWAGSMDQPKVRGLVPCCGVCAWLSSSSTATPHWFIDNI